MQLTVTGKQVDVGDALRQPCRGTLESLLGKYFRTAIEAHAVFAREAHLIPPICRCMSGAAWSSTARRGDRPLSAFDAAAERLAKQLRRYKRRLRDYHGKARPAGERPEMARCLRAGAGRRGGRRGPRQAPRPRRRRRRIAPVVIAEMSTELPQLTVGEAVMRMDLADAPVLLFRNRSHGELNVVYRRGDGNIGWIDPVNRGGGANRR